MFREYQISGTSDHLYVDGEVKQSVRLNADGFFKTLLSLPSPRLLDLLRIASGVYAVDRIAKRKRSRNNEYGIRQLHLIFEVRDVRFWEQADVSELLSKILTFLTDDDWLLEFEETKQIPSDTGHQDYLPLRKQFSPQHGALYSGGLDSAAGLANRLLEGANGFMLVTVGHQRGLHRRVDKQLKELRHLLKEFSSTNVDIWHSTLTTSLEGGKSKHMQGQERTQRSRAFLFCVAAAIAADAYGIKTVEMFENGVGAINLPLMTGMLGSGLSTRGAHPTFLRLMSELSSSVTGSSMRFTLPFEFKTKSEMLQNLKDVPNIGIWAQESRSCVHTSLREIGKTHCGRCPACIERRQAFLSAGIDEKLDVYQTNVFIDALVNPEEADYFNLYKYEAMKWEREAVNTRNRMLNYLRLTEVPSNLDEKIGELQSRHSREVLNAFGSPFMVQNKSALKLAKENVTNENGVMR